MASLKQKALKKLEDLGCVMNDDGDVLTIDPPRGMKMCESGCHSVCIGYRESIKYTDGNITGWRDANAAERWQAVIDALDEGMEECADPECDVCHPELYE